MKLGAPDRCMAIVVGIELYAATSDDWTLHGPAMDALTFVQWLRSRGVPAPNIRLFINVAGSDRPSPEWPEADLLAACARDGIACEQPHQRALQMILTRPLRRIDPIDPSDCDTLMVYWSGHGVVADRGHHRSFYTADARDDFQHAIDLSAHLEWLEKDAASGNLFQSQLVIVDACGQWESQRHNEPLTARVPTPVQPFARQTQQYTIWATEEGKFARTSEAGNLSVFTAALLQVMTARSIAPAGGADAFPDLDVVYDDLVANFKQSEQKPVLRRRQPGQEEDDAEHFGRVSPAAQKLARILATAPIGIAELRPLFNQSRPMGDIKMPKTAADSVMLLARRVGGDRQPGTCGELPSIARYAIRVASLCERLAAEVPSPALTATLTALAAWLDAEVEWPGRIAEERYLATRRRKFHHLVIDISWPPTNGIDVQLFPKHDDFKWIRHEGAGVSVDDAIRAALDLAAQCEVTLNLTIELRLSLEQLLDGLDRRDIAGYVDGFLTEWKLGSDFVTTLALRDRRGIAKPGLANAWRRVWPVVAQSLDEIGATVRWLDAPDSPANFNRLPCDTWIGLPSTPTDVYFVRGIGQGAPLIVWPGKGVHDVAALRRSIDTLLADATLDDFADGWRAAVAIDPRIRNFHVLIDRPPSEAGSEGGAAPLQFEGISQRD